MLIIRFLRFFFGYVGFSVKGGFCERFVNLCTLNSIPLWNMKKQGDTLYACTTLDAYKRIRQSAFNSGVKVKLEKKYGLPFFMNRNRRRIGILIGLFAAVCVMFVLSSMVWSVNVVGCKKLTESQVLTAFEQLGVKRGAFTRKIKASQVAYEAEKLLPQILWASVNIKGSQVEIVVCERTDAPEFPDTETPCNIVASEDGVIVSIQANIGSPQVCAADAVVKGDLLISGITENLDGSENLKSARGNVTASVKRNIYADASQSDFYVQNGEKTRRCIYILGLKIPLGLSADGENFHADCSYLSDSRMSLPVGIILEHSCSHSEKATPDRNKMTLYNADLYAAEYYKIYKNTDIVSQTVSVENTGEALCFRCEISALKDIGERREIFVENQ